MKFPLQTLRERCLATLAYFDLFDYPLTFDELREYFLGNQPQDDELMKFLKENVDLINCQDGYYFFKGRDLIVLTRGEREKVSLSYWKKVRRFLPLIQCIPFVRMVGVCNTLSINNASKDSDIDLFIVSRKGRLFFVRFMTVALFGVLGLRRHGTKIAGRFCLSFYCDESSLGLEPIQSGQQDIYLPYWVLTMKPLYGRRTYEKFIKENFWITRYFQRTLTLHHDFLRPHLLRALAWLKEQILKGRLGDWIEKKLMTEQLRRHKQNIPSLPSESSVVVTEHMLKFHNIDRRNEIAERFEQRLKLLI